VKATSFVAVSKDAVLLLKAASFDYARENQRAPLRMLH
jgi:hypothetical protein